MLIRKLTQEEVRATLETKGSRAKALSELSKELLKLEIGEGYEVEGAIEKLRPRVGQFQKERGLRFSVRAGENGFVRIIRVEPKVEPLPEIGPVNPAIAGNPFA